MKPGDENVVNLCGGFNGHHQELHQKGRKAFQRKHGVDLAIHAKRLASHSPDPRIRETAGS